MAVPQALISQGFLPLDKSKDSLLCFEEFKAWVESLQLDAKTNEKVVSFYDSLESRVYVPDYTDLEMFQRPDLCEDYPVWLDLSKFVVEKRFFDGFFSDRHPKSFEPDVTLESFVTWTQILESMQDKSGVDPTQGCHEVWGIEVRLFVDANGTMKIADFGTGGRHRIAAALALGAELIPVNVVNTPESI